MLINDVHHHIVLSPTTYRSDYSFDVFLQERSKAPGATVLFPMPNLVSLYPCVPEHHYKVESKPGSTSELKFECCNCGKISYVGADPFRHDNERLISMCRNSTNLFPFIYLSLCDNTMNYEFQYFFEHYKGCFYGIKVHPNLCCKRVSEIGFNSVYPIIIHAGMQLEDNPDDIVKFAEKYEGNVLIAHMARCKLSALQRIKELPNTFIDTSPSYLSEQICNRYFSRYYESSYFDVTSKTDAFKRLVDLVGLNKVIFGSDAPFGSIDESIELYNQLELPEDYKTAIFETNFYLFNSMA